MIRISIDDSRNAFEPGQSLAGQLEWSLDRSPRRIDLRVFWYTEGRGDRDVGVARDWPLEAPRSIGHHRFDFELPSGPHSFSGALISLSWAVEAICEPQGLSARAGFVMAPGGLEIRLPEPVEETGSMRLIR